MHLKIDINKNFSTQNEGLWLNRDDLDGLPEDVLQRREPNEFWLELNSSAIFSVRSDTTKSATRKAVYIKDAHRCPESAVLVRELFLLRDEAARLLGYSSNAAFRLQPNLVATPDKVTVFLEEMRRDIGPYVQKSLLGMIKVKKEYITNHPQEAWDDLKRFFFGTSTSTDGYSRRGSSVTMKTG